MSILKYSVSLLGLFFWWEAARAQSDFSPSAVRIGTDIVAIGQTVLSPDKDLFEVNADVAFSKYFLTLDAGMDNIVRNGEDYTYENRGKYFRLGADINFMPNDPDNNVFFFGLRYGRSYFNDNLTVRSEDDIYGAYTLYSENTNLTARWFEMATGFKVRVWKAFFLGYTFRIKFSSKINGATGNLTPYEIPGYGEAADPTEVGVNYQIFYRIPLSAKLKTPGD